MEWQQVLSFYHIAKHGSFTQAARATFRTQSAISQQIKALENELGCTLIERFGKGKIKLTPAGESFLKFSVSLLDGYDQLTTEIKEFKGQKTGRVRIAAPFETLYYLIPKNLSYFDKKYPKVEISIIDSPPTETIRLIKYGEVDIGLVPESMIPSDFLCLPWKKSERLLMTPFNHPLLKIKKVSLKDIVEYPLILPPKRFPIREKFDEKLEELSLSCHIKIESPNVVLCAECVELGLGISIIAKGLADYLEQAKKMKISMIPVNHIIGPEYFGIIMRKDKKLSFYQKEFVNMFLGKKKILS